MRMCRWLEAEGPHGEEPVSSTPNQRHILMASFHVGVTTLALASSDPFIQQQLSWFWTEPNAYYPGHGAAHQTSARIRNIRNKFRMARILPRDTLTRCDPMVEVTVDKPMPRQCRESCAPRS